MAQGAPKGNQFWKLRAKHGPPRLFTDPDALWESCLEYFEETDNRRDWDQADWVGKDALKVERPHRTPYSRKGLCIYLGITFKTWTNYRNDGDAENATQLQKDLLQIITRVEEIIDTQQYEGAAVGAFKENIIARTLGLRDAIANEIDFKQLPKIEYDIPPSDE